MTTFPRYQGWLLAGRLAGSLPPECMRRTSQSCREQKLPRKCLPSATAKTKTFFQRKRNALPGNGPEVPGKCKTKKRKGKTITLKPTVWLYGPLKNARHATLSQKKEKNAPFNAGTSRKHPWLRSAKCYALKGTHRLWKNKKKKNERSFREQNAKKKNAGWVFQLYLPRGHSYRTHYMRRGHINKDSKWNRNDNKLIKSRKLTW